MRRWTIAPQLGIGKGAPYRWSEAAQPALRERLTEDERSELPRLRRENLQLKTERDILRKSHGLHRPTERVRFAFIATEKAAYPIRVLCRTLGVSASGFYAWRGD